MSVTPKTKIRIEQIARWRVGGVSDSAICQLMEITPITLKGILQLPEFKETVDAVLAGAITKMDEAIAGKADIIVGMYRAGVPAAVSMQLEAVTQRRDMRLAFEASKEILDRDPDRCLIKTSKSANQESNPVNESAILGAAGKAQKVVDEQKAKAN